MTGKNVDIQMFLKDYMKYWMLAALILKYRKFCDILKYSKL